MDKYHDLLQAYHDLNRRQIHILNRHLTAMEIILNLQRFYPYVLSEIATKEMIDNLKYYEDE